jgi:mono/diheme cytochrome c family protein
MRNVFVTLVGLTIATSVVAAQAPDAAKVAAGQKIYEAQKCNTCHMIQGKGGKLASSLDGVGGKLSQADIKKWLTDSAAMEKNLKEKPKMPMSTFMKSHKLSDADVDALTAYMMSLK